MGYVCNTSLHRDYTCNEIVALIERAGSAAFFAQTDYGADAAKNDIFSMLGALPRLKKIYRLNPLRPDIAESGQPIGFAGLSPAGAGTLAPSSNPDRIV